MKSNLEEISRNTNVAESGPTPKQLAVFLSVCRLGSVQAAAEEAGVARQAVSRMVGQLEDLLGARLFEREARGVRPTEFGASLLPHAESVIRGLEAVAGMRTLGKMPRQPLVVATLEHVFDRIGAQFVVAFAKAEPAVTLSIQEYSDDEALAALSARRCELALVTGPFDERIFRATPLMRTRLVVRMRADHPLAQANVIRREDLIQYPLIGRGRAWRSFREGVGARLLEGADILTETTSAALEEGILRGTDAVAVGYDYALQKSAGIATRPFERLDGDTGRILAVVENRVGLRSKAAEALKKALREWASSAGVETCGCGGECQCGCNCGHCTESSTEHSERGNVRCGNCNGCGNCGHGHKKVSMLENEENVEKNEASKEPSKEPRERRSEDFKF